jgi:CspA family cold shock protein
MPKGIIRRLVADRGFGFITREEGEELFFHRSELQGVAYDSLREGQEVEFEIEQEPDFSFAVRVRLAQPKG